MATPSKEDIAAGVPAGVNITKRVTAPGGGEWLLGDDGGVFAIGGAPYLGSYMGLDAKDRQGERNIVDIVATPQGGYRLVSDDQGPDGPGYVFNPASQVAPKGAPNSLYTDPAFLAFIRTSGLATETIAADNARKQTAYQSTLDNFTIPGLNQDETKTNRGIGDSHEARGVYRSSQRAQEQNQNSTYYQGQRNQAQQNVAELVATDNATLANNIAETQRKGAELGYDVGGSQDYQSQMTTLRQKYPGMVKP